MNSPTQEALKATPQTRAGLFRKWLETSTGTALLCSTVHGLNDTYNSYLGALMPVLIDHFRLSLTMAGVLASASTLATSLFQPLFGYMLDKATVKPNIFTWPIITAIATCSIALVPNASMLIPLLVIAGLSTAAFHPHAASTVPPAGLPMALFLAGGTVGYAVGPVMSLGIVSSFGLRSLWLLAVPTVLASLFLSRFARSARREGRKNGGRFSLSLTGDRLKVFLTIWVIVAMRSTVGTTFSSFLSVHLRQTGFPLLLVGVALLVHTGAGTFGSVVGGYLSDTIGRKTVITLGTSLILVSYLLLLKSSGIWTWLFLALGGFAMNSFNPVTVVMAQDLFPENRGMAGGMVMGLGWSVGGLVVSLVGAMADRMGLATTLMRITLLLAPAALISLTLPGRYFKPHTPAGAAPTTASHGEANIQARGGSQ
ncbi:MAG: MFS transporter [Bacillota bacterium]|nr:MFS transporter [Bacillota bacterium]